MAGSNSSHQQRRSCQSQPVLESHLDALRDGAFSDVTFIVGPRKERIPAHQIFLKLRSPVFEVMFSERWNQDSNKEVPLEDVDPKIFKKFLQYIYADTLEANVSEALELLQVAHMYDVQLLVSKCERLLESQLTLDEAVDVFQTARKYDKIQLMDKAGDLMAKSLTKLQNLPSFLRVEKHTFVYILKRNDLKMKEVELFHLALRWSKNQSGLITQQSLQDVLPLIRFPTMTLEEFTTTVVPTGLLPLFTLVEIFTYFGTNAEARGSLASDLKFSTQRRDVDSGNNQVCRLLASSSVELYSTPLTLSYRRSRRQTCTQLYELLDLCVFVVHDGVSPPAKRNIALSGISVYCPTRRTDTSGRIATNLTKELQIFVKAKINDKDDYEYITLCPLQAEKGKITEVEFNSAIPVKSGKYFRVMIEEMKEKTSTRTRRYEDLEYEIEDFGSIHKNVITSVGDSRVFVGCSASSSTLDTGGRPVYPQLIHKLCLKEY